MGGNRQETKPPTHRNEGLRRPPATEAEITPRPQALERMKNTDPASATPLRGGLVECHNNPSAHQKAGVDRRRLTPALQVQPNLFRKVWPKRVLFALCLATHYSFQGLEQSETLITTTKKFIYSLPKQCIL